MDFYGSVLLSRQQSERLPLSFSHTNNFSQININAHALWIIIVILVPQNESHLDSFYLIEQKLEHFIRRYYISALLKGALLFFAIGLLYVFLILSIEHFFWLNSFGRRLLFAGGIGVEALLFYGFILIPLAKYFKLQNGINLEAASKIVGDHFPEVKDKLLNVLQLNQQSEQTEFLLASIEQKSKNLSIIPFKSAVNFSDNLKYLRYAAAPLLIIFVCILFGKQAVFTDSLDRVVNYKTAYAPPAPFEFFVMNTSLEAIENTPFTVVVKTVGSVVPEDVQIVYNEEAYILSQTQLGVFEYTFTQPKFALNFSLTANELESKRYRLEVSPIPVLLSFDMYLDYPAYTGKSDENITNNGNATIPEGTILRWDLRTKSTDTVAFAYKDTIAFFNQNTHNFYYSKRVFESLNYTIQTSNTQLKNYERLTFSIKSVKDQSPAIKVEMKQDSTLQEPLYFYGQISDDYGISNLKLFYYPVDDMANRSELVLPSNATTFQEFTHAFPSNLELIDDTAYALYFEVADNDPFHNTKTTRSRVFNYNSKSENTIQDLQLKEQNELTKEFQKALNALSEQDKNLETLSKNQKEKEQLNFSDQQKLKSFLERQQAQDKILKNFNKKMQENLNQFEKSNAEDPFKDALENRLEAQQEALKKDEKLLEELKKVTDKINKEALAEKLDDMAKQNKNKQRSLEQLLELTKRFYVTKKAEQIKTTLDVLSEEQTELSKASEENNTKEAQDKLNTEFEDLQKDLDALRKDNESLSKPLALPDDPSLEESIKNDQKQASEDLGKKEGSSDTQEQSKRSKKAQKSQQKAAQKMQQMSQQMAQQMSSGSGEQMREDIDMLRKILDNLLLFSFDQEALMKRFQSSSNTNTDYAKRLVKQNDLREHFEHIDDSLFSLSLRQPKISEPINKEITEVYFNIDKSLELLSENSFRKAIGAQQFVVSATNSLADKLSNTLDNMEMQMQISPGQGEGEMQLPDIIMSQEELNKQMEKELGKSSGQPNGEQEGSEKGKDGSQQSSDEGKEGSLSSKEGQSGKNGKQGKDGVNGGQNGQSVQEGDSEVDTGELFEIFKKQQSLRNALQDLLDKNGLRGNGNTLLDAMEKIEQNLINQGLTSKSLEDMTALKHQLLKLEKAVQQQGEDTKRVSNTNNSGRFQVPVPSLETIKQYFNTTEILNRQSLPLRQKYKLKVQDYFKNNND
jgi:hypothetical protein